MILRSVTKLAKENTATSNKQKKKKKKKKIDSSNLLSYKN